MRILFVCPSFPFPPHDGERLRAYHFLRELSKRNRIHLLTFFSGRAELEHLPALADMGIHVEPLPLPPFGPVQVASAILRSEPFLSIRRESAQLRQRLTELAPYFDSVHLDGLPLAQYVPLLARLGAHVVLDLRDAWSVVAAGKVAQAAPGPRRMVAWLQHRVLRGYEREVLSLPAQKVLLSASDKAALLALSPAAASIVLIPNGVDTRYFAPGLGPNPAAQPTLVFTGAMAYRPNAEAVLYFAQEILPLVHKSVPDARFVAVGRNPGSELLRLRSPYVEITGDVEDVRPHLHKAHVVVSPLLTGAGIKNKVLEAMAAGKAQVTTPKGVEGIPALDGVHAAIREGKVPFADAVVTLLESAERREIMGEKARELVLAHFSWEASAQRLEALHAGR